MKPRNCLRVAVFLVTALAMANRPLRSTGQDEIAVGPRVRARP